METGTLEQEPSRRHRAYHQSGHVIANLVSGYRFAFVSIGTAAAGEDDGAVCGNVRGRARDLAVVRLAGIAASAKMSGRENPDEFDDDRADIAAARTFIDDWAGFLLRTYGERPGTRLWDEIGDRTRLLAEENWKAIECIAGALLEKESLSYDDVIRILKDQCPDFRPAEKT